MKLLRTKCSHQPFVRAGSRTATYWTSPASAVTRLTRHRYKKSANYTPEHLAIFLNFLQRKVELLFIWELMVEKFVGAAVFLNYDENPFNLTMRTTAWISRNCLKLRSRGGTRGDNQAGHSSSRSQDHF